MATNEQIIKDFNAAFARLNADEVMGFFTDDVVYHNIPWPAAVGKAEVRKVIEGFFTGMGMTAANFEVIKQVCAGNLVMNERVDYLTVGGKQVALPVCGVFELQGGKIKAWRDYFDADTFNKAIAG